MATGADDRRTQSGEEPSFELQRFAWLGPDRLEVAGTFAGLPDRIGDEPVLVVDGAGGAHRLSAVAGSSTGAPVNGEVWSAAFAWEEAPTPFDAAELAFGDLVVLLPAPGTSSGMADVGRVDAAEGEPVRTEAPTADDPAGALILQAELVAAREDARQAREELERTREELARARTDLDGERQGRAEDGERFRAGLDAVRDAGERALREAHEAISERDAEAEDRRAEITQLRDRLSEIQREADERERRAAEEAQRETAQLRNRLTAIREAMGEDT